MRITPECLKGRQDQMRLRKSDSPSSAAHPEYLRLADEQEATQTKARTGIMGETLYTLDEIAKHLKVSKETARRMFAGESGVLALNSRGHRSTVNGRVRLRVPQSVFNRVINGMEKI
jgi:hypothetical protein